MGEIEEFNNLVNIQLRFVMLQKSKEEVIKIIKRNSMAIQFIENPSVELQLLALEHDINSYHHIKNPCKEATAYYLLKQ